MECLCDYTEQESESAKALFVQSAKCLQLFQVKSVLGIPSVTFNSELCNDNHYLIVSTTINLVGY